MTRQDGTRFKDHFSECSQAYRRFRPSYPDQMFSYLQSLAPGRRAAWDVATGNGQAALGLCRYFDRVVASDASPQQLASADSHPRLDYLACLAEAAGLASGTLDCVTVAQALHWFDRPAFFRESARVLRAGGVIAVWTYGLGRVDGAVDAVMDRFYWEELKGYWPPERALVESRYADIDFPFQEIQAPPLRMREEWSLLHFAGYLKTWSAVRARAGKTGSNPVDTLLPRLARVWGPAERVRPVSWPVRLRVGRTVH